MARPNSAPLPTIPTDNGRTHAPTVADPDLVMRYTHDLLRLIEHWKDLASEAENLSNTAAYYEQMIETESARLARISPKSMSYVEAQGGVEHATKTARRMQRDSEAARDQQARIGSLICALQAGNVSAITDPALAEVRASYPGLTAYCGRMLAAVE